MLQPLDPYRYLAVAIVLQAVKEAAAGDIEARTWLLTGGQLYLDTLGIGMDPGRLRVWFDAGCPLCCSRRGKRPRHRAPGLELGRADQSTLDR